MSYDFWRSKIVKARKSYSCDECRAIIKVGEHHDYGVGKTEGCLMEQRLCLTCNAIITEGFHADIWDDDGFPLGEVRSWLREEHGIEDADAWAVEHRSARMAKNTAEAAKKAAMALPSTWKPTHRHVKTGGLYQVIAEGFDAWNGHGEEAPPITIYRNDAGVWWSRPTEEFSDGRFEQVTP